MGRGDETNSGIATSKSRWNSVSERVFTCVWVCICECTFLYVFNSLWWAEPGTRVWLLRWKAWRPVMSGIRPLLWTVLLFEGDVAKVTRSLFEMRVGVKRLQQRNLVLLLIIVWGLCIRGFGSEESLFYRKAFDQSKLLKLKQKKCVSSSVKKLKSQWDLGRNRKKFDQAAHSSASSS